MGLKTDIFDALKKNIEPSNPGENYEFNDGGKLDEVLVSSNSNSTVEDRTSQLTASQTKKTNTQSRVPTPTLPSTNTALTKDAILNDILAETAANGDWKKINEEPQVQSVTENTQGLPDHLANALNKDYSEVMEKVEEKARFKNGA